MVEFARSRHIAAPAERIWPYVDDVTSWPKWFTEAERATLAAIYDGVSRSVNGNERPLSRKMLGLRCVES